MLLQAQVRCCCLGRARPGGGHLPAYPSRASARLLDVTVLDKQAAVALLDEVLRVARRAMTV